MKIDGDMVGRCIATTLKNNQSVTPARRLRGFDAIVSTVVLALLVAAIASGNQISDELGGASADQQSYFVSAVLFVVNFVISIGLTWLLLFSRPRGESLGARP